MTHNNRVRLSKLSLGLIVALAAAPVFAQSTSAGVGGRVVGADGQPVAGAEVTITHTESGTVSRVATDANGNYSARGLRVGGPYTITVNKAGAGSSSKGDVYLGLDKVATVDTQLNNDVSTLGAVTVVGTASTNVFQSDNKGLSTTVSQRDLQTTPMPSRSIQDVARLDPRVVVTDRGRGEISALGQNSRYNNISVDAVGVNDPFGLEANGLPYIGTPISVDTIEEYNISTANYDVINRRSVGANINAVTKSGTNDFHGSVYYSFRDADNMVGDEIKGEKSEFNGFEKEWTAGVTFGGPIIKDKLFFFASHEESRVVAPGPSSGPEGSGFANQVDNLTQDDLNRIISIANGYGLRPGSLDSASINTETKRDLFKIDWNINESHRASFRYNQVKETEPVLNGQGSRSGVSLSSYWYSKERENKNYVLNLYDDWSDSFSTEATISYTDYLVLRDGLLGNQPQVIINVGPDNTRPFVDLGEEQFSHYNELGVKTWNAFFAGTWYLGDHELKAGFDLQRDEFYNLFGRTQFGAYTFNGIDNFENGVYRQFDLYQPAPGLTIDDVAARWTLRQTGYFVQDTWQATDNLSVQYGFRYDVPSTSDKPLYNACFASAPIADGSGPEGCEFGGFGFQNNNTINGNRVIQPRFSFNYNFPTEKYQTQLRGGIGLFQGNTLGVWLTNPYQNNGLTVATYSIRNSSDDPAVSGQFPFSGDPLNQNVPPPSSSQMSVDTLDQGYKQPTVWKASLAFDRELPWWGTVFSAEWQHLKVKNGVFYKNLNIGDPTGVLPDGRLSFYCNPEGGTSGNTNRCNANSRFAQAVTLLTNTDKGDADNLSLTLRKPFADDWAASLGVAFSRATEVNPGTSSQASSNFSNNFWTNPNEDVAATSNYNVDRRVTASLSWQHRFFGDYATGVSLFYDGHTGRPYTWAFGNDANGDSYSRDLVYIPRPGDVDFAGGTEQSTIDQFYAYIQSDSYLKDHQGEIAERNAATSPWVNQIDLSLRQELPGFFDGAKGEVRVDIFNFGNLLNSDWGVEERANSFPPGRVLANYQGVNADGKYIYQLPTDSNGNYLPGRLDVYDDRAVSRWSVLVTLRYSF